jgi:hypothetical protein
MPPHNYIHCSHPQLSDLLFDLAREQEAHKDGKQLITKSYSLAAF